MKQLARDRFHERLQSPHRNQLYMENSAILDVDLYVVAVVENCVSPEYNSANLAAVGLEIYQTAWNVYLDLIREFLRE